MVSNWRPAHESSHEHAELYIEALSAGLSNGRSGASHGQEAIVSRDGE